jgi:hypothetical protein
MIRVLFRAAHRLDGWLEAKLGQPYRVLLGVGLAIEILQHIREFPHVLHSGRGLVLHILALLLFAALLLHQIGEIYQRLEAQRQRPPSQS